MRRATFKVGNAPRLVIPKAFTHGMELVILTREVYEREVKRTQEITEALQAITEGERAYREGRTLKATSLEEALKLHAKRSH